MKARKPSEFGKLLALASRMHQPLREHSSDAHGGRSILVALLELHGEGKSKIPEGIRDRYEAGGKRRREVL